jgi:exopolysaccharide biosynthesis WecB/TagA/CpsF family protein
MEKQRSILLGVPVDNLDMEQTLSRIFDMVKDYQNDSINRLVATANVDFMVNAHNRKDSKNAKNLLSILRKADLVTADGMPLVWLSQLLGEPLKERVTGADMVPALAKKASLEGKSIYFFGGADGSAKQTAKIFKGLYPELKIAGFSAPMIDMEDEIENMVEIARINVTEPDILLIALGNPKQEFWFDRYKKYMKVPVSIGVGGTFEFISGVTSRAPEWMQKTGLEWIFRMAQDPKRLINRYAKGLFSFNRMVLPLLLVNSVAKKMAPKQLPTQDQGQAGGTEVMLHDQLSMIQGMNAFITQTATGPVMHLDFKNVFALSSADISNFMSVLLLAGKEHMKINAFNLRFLPRMLMKVYKIQDLLHPGNELPNGPETYAA